jgi:uncharacterized membrane protein YoaK (UPF0700 family)
VTMRIPASQRAHVVGATVETASGAPRAYCGSLGLASLSLASGCMDVLSFLKLGYVFTSAMTGNTALLAIAIGHGRLLAASRSLCALLGFALGVVLATLLYAPWNAEQRARGALTRILLVELVFLVGCATLWSACVEPIPPTVLYAVIALAALSMGMQAVGARSINSSGISTIVFTTGLIHIVMSATGTLARRAGASVGGSWISNAHLRTFAAYGLGAVLAALFVSHDVEAAIWLPAGAVSCALGLSLLGERRERNSAFHLQQSQAKPQQT